MSRTRILVIVLAVIALVATLVVLCRRSREAPIPMPASSASAPTPEGEGTARLEPTVAPISSTVRDRKVRDQVRERIYASQGLPPPPAGGVPRNAGAAPAPAPSAAASEPGLDKDYIQSVFRSDFYPLAKQCYEAALVSNPKLQGKLVVFFTIVGDRKVGGIVESAVIDEGTTIEDPKLQQCFTESVMTLAFKPPAGSGKVTVRYPILLSPDAPADGGGS